MHGGHPPTGLKTGTKRVRALKIPSASREVKAVAGELADLELEAELAEVVGLALVVGASCTMPCPC